MVVPHYVCIEHKATQCSFSNSQIQCGEDENQCHACQSKHQYHQQVSVGAFFALGAAQDHAQVWLTLSTEYSRALAVTMTAFCA